MKYWDIEILKYWNIGIMKYWEIERQQEHFKLLFDRKTTQVKSEDNLQIVVKKRLFGEEYQKENVQGNVTVRKKPLEGSPIFVESNVDKMGLSWAKLSTKFAI